MYNILSARRSRSLSIWFFFEGYQVNRITASTITSRLIHSTRFSTLTKQSAQVEQKILGTDQYLLFDRNSCTQYFILSLHFIIFIAKDFSPSSSSSLRESRGSIAILYQDQSDMIAIKDVLGDFLQFTNTFESRDPRSLKELLLSADKSVRSCFIVVQSINMKEELLTKSSSTGYQDLLKAASLTVGKNVFSLTFFPACFINCCTRSNCWGRGQGGSCLLRIN